MSDNLRSKSKYDNLSKAMRALSLSLSSPITEARDLSGIIKDFEIVYELGWKSLKSVLFDEGHETSTARDVFRKSFQLGILKQENVWLDVIEDRNKTVHTYDENFAKDLVERIRTKHHQAFLELQSAVRKMLDGK